MSFTVSKDMHWLAIRMLFIFLAFIGEKDELQIGIFFSGFCSETFKNLGAVARRSVISTLKDRVVSELFLKSLYLIFSVPLR